MLFVFTQPRTGSHVSSVHGLASSQSGAAPPTHMPPEHVSPVVHASPSSQGSVLSTFRQPRTESQESSVQGLASSQSGAAPPTQTPAAQVSPVVQALPSSHDSMLSTLTQPRTESHESLVHGLPSSQSSGAPPTHDPPEQVSSIVHASPSSHGSELSVLTHPVAGSHVSSVQMLPSSQSAGAPPTQVPAAHVSPTVQASPSSHGSVLLANSQTPPRQLSVVQGLPSSQSATTMQVMQPGMGDPTQVPAEQVSAWVHGMPSSHEIVLFPLTQPRTGSQESVVQMLPSSQSGAGPPTHTPASHVSSVVQALPSSHGSVLST